jgi:hypothetical protein
LQVLRGTTALFYPFRKRKIYARDKSSFFATRFALYIFAGWRYALLTAYQLVCGKSHPATTGAAHIFYPTTLSRGATAPRAFLCKKRSGDSPKRFLPFRFFTPLWRE